MNIKRGIRKIVDFIGNKDAALAKRAIKDVLYKKTLKAISEKEKKMSKELFK